MKVARFEDLKVWQKSRNLTVHIYRHTSQGAFARDFALHDQIRRASISVMSNIAEGFGRYGQPELRHFLSIARGPVPEVQSQRYLARELAYIDPHETCRLIDECTQIGRMLSGLRASLDRDRSSPARRPPPHQRTNALTHQPTAVTARRASPAPRGCPPPGPGPRAIPPGRRPGWEPASCARPGGRPRRSWPRTSPRPRGRPRPASP